MNKPVMRLSQAIRLGAMLHPQAFGTTNWKNQRTCALGAAGMAAGVGCKLNDIREAFPILDQQVNLIPGFRIATPTPLSNAIASLNDQPRWTREQIADWVETLECERDIPDTARPQEVERQAEVVVANS
jgi:hypothetical protein